MAIDFSNVKNMIKRLEKYSTATLHEASGKSGFISNSIKPIDKSMKVCGKVLTFKGCMQDNLVLHRALEIAEKGDVLVGTVGDGQLFGYWGEILTVSAVSRGIKGLVFDGGIRDTEYIIPNGFPVFCNGVSIKGTQKNYRGEINIPIVLGEAYIKPGDVIVGDMDGLFYTEADKIPDLLIKAEERVKMENEQREMLRSGASTMDILNLK